VNFEFLANTIYLKYDLYLTPGQDLDASTHHEVLQDVDGSLRQRHVLELAPHTKWAVTGHQEVEAKPVVLRSW